MLVAAAIVIGLLALAWLLAAPPADSVAQRASAVGALRSAVERAAAYEPPPPGPEPPDGSRNVHLLDPGEGHRGVAPAA